MGMMIRGTRGVGVYRSPGVGWYTIYCDKTSTKVTDFLGAEQALNIFNFSVISLIVSQLIDCEDDWDMVHLSIEDKNILPRG